MLLYIELSDNYKQLNIAILIRKTINILKQSSCKLHKNMLAKLSKANLTQLISDYSVFIRNTRINKIIILAILIIFYY